MEGGERTPSPERPDRGRRDSGRQRITISFQARDYLAAENVDSSLLAGARNAVTKCLGLRGSEELMLVVESGLETVGAALLQEATKIGVEVVAYIVDEAYARNERFVTRLATKLDGAQASLLVATSEGLPRDFRARLLPGPGATRRHGHMVGITESMMCQSMRADYDEVDALGEALRQRLSPSSTIDVRTPMGTDLTIRCDPGCRVHNASGRLSEGGLTNLPGGEVLTTPASVDGTLVPDGGAWLPDGREIGRRGKLQLRFEQGRLVGVQGGESDALEQAVDAAEHGRRVGQVGFGTNTSVLTPVGASLQDLKMPGLHLTLGDTAAELTGASWRSEIQVPLLPRRPDVRIDGTPVLVRGRYVPDITPA